MKFGERKTLLLLVSFFAITCLFTRLGQGNLPSYDDAYYAQKAKEILATGDWWTMHFAGKPKFDNPPGFMWLEALSFKAFGVNEFAARFPSALGGLLGILGTFFLFELLFSTRIGLFAAVALNLTSVYLKYARHSMMDTTVTAAVVWCFYFFVKAMRGGSQWLYVVAGLIASYVFFAKSAFGVLPPAALFVYLLATRQFFPFKKWGFWLGLVAMFLPYGLWSWLQYQQFGQNFIEAHFLKLIIYSSQTRGVNDYWYDYIVVILKYFPLFLPFMFLGIWQALKARGEEAKNYWFALIYFVIFFMFLTMQGTKKTWYFLPTFPACAGLAAVGLELWLKKYSLEKIGRGFSYFAVAVFLVLNVTPVSLGIERAVDTKALAPYVRAAGEQGFHIMGYNIDYYGLNNALLFYSDFAAQKVLDDDLRLALQDKQKVAVVFSPEEWARVGAQFSELMVVRKTPKLIFVANFPIDQLEVF